MSPRTICTASLAALVAAAAAAAANVVPRAASDAATCFESRGAAQA